MTEVEQLNPPTKQKKASHTVVLPYISGYGYIPKTLERIKTAATPERFTQDFLAAKLGLKGGSPKAVIPFFKRTGFLNSDGTPTAIYREFRNSSLMGRACARAIKKGYATLYEINEYVHELNDKELEGVIVQATGLNAKSDIVKKVIGSFKSLKQYAIFDDTPSSSRSGGSDELYQQQIPEQSVSTERVLPSVDLKLGYTINLYLPPTTDIAVFDAIFKSLREHLLEK